jgi:hypothetical protein
MYNEIIRSILQTMEPILIQKQLFIAEQLYKNGDQLLLLDREHERHAIEHSHLFIV